MDELLQSKKLVSEVLAKVFCVGTELNDVSDRLRRLGHAISYDSQQSQSSASHNVLQLPNEVLIKLLTYIEDHQSLCNVSEVKKQGGLSTYKRSLLLRPC